MTRQSCPGMETVVFYSRHGIMDEVQRAEERSISQGRPTGGGVGC